MWFHQHGCSKAFGVKRLILACCSVFSSFLSFPFFIVYLFL
ncbi:hypothetical protein CORMATOL_03050 [Corynebacterium matruchotii ATCC 33806]|uniref:Uncharacterized protein n=1 Tax=Corynebacterium matruchotii ATCC 33806 TaxID=566549 RepID=C0E7Q8_9CORY|nr:hypothetical protein CORMATOL_03050 [Corynebacterium matruchotii ATCC 33806]